MNQLSIRKVLQFEERVHGDRQRAARIITRVAGAVVFDNPFAGQVVTDLAPLFDLGGEAGALLADELAARLVHPPESYGKAAVVGSAGEFEHGAAIIHPKLGKPMRDALQGGQALIPSNVKFGGPGVSIDVPLGHKDNAWSFDHFDTLTLTFADAPRPDELVLIVAFADGGRVRPRSGDGPVRT